MHDGERIAVRRYSPHMSRDSRLSTALADGALQIPGGGVTVMRPGMTYDVGAIPRDQVTIQHTFRPDYAAWEAAGYPVQQECPKDAKMAVVVVPRAKALAKAMIAEAARIADIVVVDGAKTDGIDSLYKACRKAVGDLPSITKAHGRLFWFGQTDVFADWTAPQPVKGDHGFFTTAGVFSDGAIDKGSQLLISALPDRLPKRIADIGAGWGYLSEHALKKEGIAAIDLIEAEALSLTCARQNVTDPRANFHWDDAIQFAPDMAYDGIIMNPPFHVGRSADPSLGRAFIMAAARLLTPQGKLWMVANRHLPYEPTLAEAFRNVDTVAQSNAFKVFHATRPRRPGDR
ncbi:MAG: class I SAM-dependent methyltransferase [Pseudomonadota bacterium]